MSKYRILALVHESLIPPPKIDKTKINRIETEWITESDVIEHLKKRGHSVKVLGLYSDLAPIKQKISEFKPHIIFNILEEFQEQRHHLHNLLSYLELLGVKYTGCNPQAMTITVDKSMTKKVLKYHGINTPHFLVFKKGMSIKIPKNLNYPLIVKCLTEEGSLGLSKASIVHNRDKLKERILYLHKKINDHAIVEEFVEGRELFVGVIGNKNPKVLPTWELIFENVETPEKEIYSARAKMNSDYRKRKGIRDQRAKLDKDLEKKINKTVLKAYKVLGISGYARFDLRIDQTGTIHIIEVNPNPDLAFDDEFARSAIHQGISYTQLLERIIKLGLNYNPIS